MAIGIRIQDLRKTYRSAPPFAAGGGFASRGGKQGKQPKPQITALDGLSLEVAGGEIFGFSVQTGQGNPRLSESLPPECAQIRAKPGLVTTTSGRNKSPSSV